MLPSKYRLRKHADFQRVYSGSRKNFSRQMSYFFAVPVVPSGEGDRHSSQPETPRVGLTVGRVMGNAVARNRIKRRMREAIRREISCLPAGVDVVFHPRRDVSTLDFQVLRREIASVFRVIQRSTAAGKN